MPGRRLAAGSGARPAAGRTTSTRCSGRRAARWWWRRIRTTKASAAAGCWRPAPRPAGRRGWWWSATAPARIPIRAPGRATGWWRCGRPRRGRRSPNSGSTRRATSTSSACRTPRCRSDGRAISMPPWRRCCRAAGPAPGNVFAAWRHDPHRDHTASFAIVAAALRTLAAGYAVLRLSGLGPGLRASHPGLPAAGGAAAAGAAARLPAGRRAPPAGQAARGRGACLAGLGADRRRPGRLPPAGGGAGPGLPPLRAVPGGGRMSRPPQLPAGRLFRGDLRPRSRSLALRRQRLRAGEIRRDPRRPGPAAIRAGCWRSAARSAC